jgi:hypothetical protein
MTQRGFLLLLRSTLQGMLAGLALALLYAAAAGLLTGGLAGSLSMFMFLASFGILPAMIIGAVSGTLIFVLVVEYARRSPLEAALLGCLIPLLAATFLLGWSIFSGGTSNRSFWAMVIGLPCLIYVFSGSSFGWAIHRRLPAAWTARRSPQLSPKITYTLLVGMVLLNAAYLSFIF